MLALGKSRGGNSIQEIPRIQWRKRISGIKLARGGSVVEPAKTFRVTVNAAGWSPPGTSTTLVEAVGGNYASGSARRDMQHSALLFSSRDSRVEKDPAV